MNATTFERANLTSPSVDADDRELAARLARGDGDAFDLLVERYAARVQALAARLLGWRAGADDVAQDVFLAVLGKAGAFRGEASLWTYLATITVNRCRSVRRRHWLGEKVLAVVAPLRHAAPAPAELQAERDDTGSAVRAAIEQLPATYREVLVLRYLEELSLDEMAQVLGVRRNTIEVRLVRARRMIEPKLARLID